ncbi:undecaprenyl-diphosphatase [Oikeobacillus pervagus]|uniref:Undecaprenyl-diphosphatase n=1 Tax=Oikeobacillus pervagus TaxID=1325931 RepID=A0AAJ1WLK5_9BACI|nr:YqaA family protein [Oikeobacillus pervagus]MDQ0216301.1 undecaprenyl-diphosphatase [Oikeobacillus pervagus]
MSELIVQIEEWLLQYGVLGLILVAFTESSFFPIPPDVILLPLALARPEEAFLYASYTTLASVFGSLLGWYIGRKLGRPILRYFISDEKIAKVEDLFKRYGALAILIAGFTPIPYKVFTIFSGIAQIPIKVLIIWSFIGRGLRFFLEAALVVALGAKAKPFIEENFTLITLIGGVTILLLFIIYRIIQKKKKTL